MIDEPEKLADGPYSCGGNAAAAVADGAQNGGFLCARHQKCDAPTALESRIGHGDADLRPPVRDGRNPALAVIEYGFPGQQRGGMTVGAETEQRDVEERTVRIERGRAVG